MATRCIIAEPYGDGWRGRYSHWDGYPDAKVPQLLTLVKRDGVETVRKVLLHDNYSWSSISPDCVVDPSITGEKYTGWNVGEKYTGWNVVAGYGEAHNDLDSAPDFFTQRNTDFAWAEFLYVLGDASVFVFRAGGDSDATVWDFVREVRYDSELSLT